MKIIKSIQKRYREFINVLQHGSKILVLSDSHGEVFEYINDHNMILPHLINVKMVGGATAYGLNNDSSQTNAFQRFIQEVEKFHTYNIVLIQLGEIDCSFLIWKKQSNSNESASDILNKSISGYERLIVKLIDMKKEVIISGAVLPTIKDYQSNPETIAIRNTINATQLDRTTLTKEFNDKLKNLADKYKVQYIDITQECLNQETNLIDDKYVKKIIDNHHAIEYTSVLWSSKLHSILSHKSSDV